MRQDNGLVNSIGDTEVFGLTVKHQGTRNLKHAIVLSIEAKQYLLSAQKARSKHGHQPSDLRTLCCQECLHQVLSQTLIISFFFFFFSQSSDRSTTLIYGLNKEFECSHIVLCLAYFGPRRYLCMLFCTCKIVLITTRADFTKSCCV